MLVKQGLLQTFRKYTNDLNSSLTQGMAWNRGRNDTRVKGEYRVKGKYVITIRLFKDISA